MDSQDIPPRSVQPGYHHDFISNREPIKALCCKRAHFEPGIRSAFPTLHGRLAAVLEPGSDHANRAKLSTSSTLRVCRHWRWLCSLECHGRSFSHFADEFAMLASVI